MNDSCSLPSHPPVYTLYAYSRVGAVLNRSKEEPDTSGPANTTNCFFERNNATDGGGIYSAAGFDIIEGCWFEENLAGSCISRADVDRASLR